MKSIVTFFVLFLFLAKGIKAQDCPGVSVSVFGVEPQSGSYNFWGVRVTLAETHDQDITVAGSIREEGGGASEPFTLVVTAGNLSVETPANFLRACPACNAEVIVSSVTPCPASNVTPDVLANDADFQLNFNIDQQLLELERDSLSLLSDEQYVQLIEETKQAQTRVQVLGIYTQYQLKSPEQVLTLSEQKLVALEAVVSRYPQMGNLSSANLNQLIKDAYAVLKSQASSPMRAAPADCVRDYVDAIDDCDTDFTIGTAASILGGLFGGVFGTPVVGYGVVTVGIATAYAYNVRCTKTAARSYRTCMGYR